MSGATTFERSARFWMHAYPLRWRELHGEALLGVLEETHEGDGHRLPKRLPRAEVVGLLRAGWGLRFREHPPFWRWLGYRMLDLRMPAVYWFWVVDDIRAPLYLWVRIAGTQWPVWALWLTTVFLPGGPLSLLVSPVFWVLYGTMLGPVAFALRRRARSMAWKHHIVEGYVPDAIRAQTT